MKLDINQPIHTQGQGAPADAAHRTIRFTVSLPEELLKILDDKVNQKNYSSRSEYIRDLIRHEIVEDKWLDDHSQVTGVLTVIYDTHEKEIIHKILEIEKSTKTFIVSSTRIHLDHHNCLETIMIRGKPAEIARMRDEISGIRGIKFCTLTKASAVDK